MQPTEITINEFDLLNIKPGSVVFVLGRRGSGKSFLLNDIVWHCKDYVDGMAFTGSAKPRVLNGVDQPWSWEHAFPDTFVYNSYHPELVDAFYNEKDNQMKNGTLKPSLLIFDDMSFQRKKMKDDPTFDKILRNGRHRLITVIVVMHDACDMPNDARGQIDFLFCFADSSYNNTDRLYKHYFGLFESPGMFRHVFFKITEDYTTLVCNRCAKSNTIEDSISYYRAYSHSNYTFGSIAFWNFHLRNYNQNHAAHNKELEKLVHQKKPMVNVVKIPRQGTLPSKRHHPFTDDSQNDDSESDISDYSSSSQQYEPLQEEDFEEDDDTYDSGSYDESDWEEEEEESKQVNQKIVRV